MPRNTNKYNTREAPPPSGFWAGLENQPVWKLMLLVAGFAFSERLIVTLVLFLRYGWQTVSGIELWFYYGVAKGTFPLYSWWDPSWWLLSGLGLLFSGFPLLYSVFLLSSLTESVNSAVFCLFIGELHGRRAGFLAGLVYASAVLPMFNSAGTVTHDVFGYSFLILSLYGVLLAVKRPQTGWKVAGAGIAMLALQIGRHVGPSIAMAYGAILIYLLWVAAQAFTEGEGRTRWLALAASAAGVAGVTAGGGTFIFGGVGIAAFAVCLGSLAVFFGALEGLRRGIRSGAPEVPAGILALAFFGFALVFRGYGLLGEEGNFPWGLIPALAGAGAVFALARRALVRGKDHVLIPMAFFLLVAFVILLLLHFEVMPELKERMFDIALKERGIDVRLQIQAGSGDLLGSSLGDYWLRFNFLLFFLPVGLWAAFRKRDMLSWALILSGLLASLAADRGTRPLTFGFVAMGVLAFTGWKRGYGWILAGWMGFIIGKFGGMYSTEYAVFFPAMAVATYLGLQWPARETARRVSLAVLALTAAWVGIGGYLGWKIFGAKQILMSPSESARSAQNLIERIQGSWDIPLCLMVILLLIVWYARGLSWGLKLRNPGRTWLTSALLNTLLGFLTLGAVYLVWVKPPGIYPWIYLLAPAVFAPVVAFLERLPGAEIRERKHFWVVALVCWLFAVIIPSMNQTPKSTQAEYDLYQWMEGNLPSGGKLFVPWSHGYMAQAVSGFPSELSPEKIDFQLPQVYWMPEESAADILLSRNIRYLVATDRFFQLLAVNRKTGEFRFRFSPDVVYQPQQFGINTLDKIKPTLLYRLLYEPEGLARFRLLHRSEDSKSPEIFMVFQILPARKPS